MNTLLRNSIFAYMLKREDLRINKAAHPDNPEAWTKDPILKKYKFTNVYRDDDRTTRAMRSVYLTGLSKNPGALAMLLVNAGIARYFGTLEFYEALGWQQTWNPGRVLDLAKYRMAGKQRVFTGAYVITNGGRSEPKEDVVVDYLSGLAENADDLVYDLGLNCSWQRTINSMKKLDGFGGTGFMAKEILQDYLMMYSGEVLDRYSYTPVGPGAQRGYLRLYPSTKRRTATEWSGLVRKLWEELVGTWENEDFTRRLSAHDVQFNLCEFDKYERTRLGEGRPRSNYTPHLRNGIEIA